MNLGIGLQKQGQIIKNIVCFFVLFYMIFADIQKKQLAADEIHQINLT